MSENNGCVAVALGGTVPEVELLAAVTDAEVQERIELRIRDHNQRIAGYEEYIRDRRTEIVATPAKIVNLFHWKRTLEAAGFTIRMSDWVDQLYLSVQKMDMVVLARILGPMNECRNVTEDDVANVGLEERQRAAKEAGRRPPRKQYMAEVTCTPQRHDYITITFTTPVKRGKCKIVTVITKRKELQCEV